MTQDEMKKAVGQAALAYVQPNTIIGVGTGSTVNCFIDALASIKDQIKAAVSSSEASTARLKALGITVVDLNDVTEFDIYVDGADEINPEMEMIKGGGAALTREKIVAAVAKKVTVLGKFPLPVEVIPLAREYVARELKKLGGTPVYREGVITDNQCQILDVHGLQITNAKALELVINQIPGVVTVGLFAQRGADVALIGSPEGITTITK